MGFISIPCDQFSITFMWNDRENIYFANSLNKIFCKILTYVFLYPVQMIIPHTHYEVGKILTGGIQYSV